MCGIAGLWQLAGSRDLAAQSRAMTKAIAARGPDGEGHWTDAAAGITLGHRRLAIIDLSPTGFQPMTSADGRIVITYNGELYNRAEMAAELDRPWRGTSDVVPSWKLVAANSSSTRSFAPSRPLRKPSRTKVSAEKPAIRVRSRSKNAAMCGPAGLSSISRVSSLVRTSVLSSPYRPDLSPRMGGR